VRPRGIIERVEVHVERSGATKTFWARWKHIARKIGNFQARVVLTLFYFTLAAPFGTAARWLSDPLRLKRRHARPEWHARPEPAADLAGLRQQS